MKFIILINVKMPTDNICWHFHIYKPDKYKIWDLKPVQLHEFGYYSRSDFTLFAKEDTSGLI